MLRAVLARVRRRPPTGTVNYGLAGVRARAQGQAGRLDASVHIARLARRGDDGMTVMDLYNHVLPATVAYRQPGGNR